MRVPATAPTILPADKLELGDAVREGVIVVAGGFWLKVGVASLDVSVGAN